MEKAVVSESCSVYLLQGHQIKTGMKISHFLLICDYIAVRYRNKTEKTKS